MKKHIFSLLVLLSAPAAYANTINAQALQACSFIENDFNRLLCYDNTVAGKSLTNSIQHTKPLQVNEPPAPSMAKTPLPNKANKPVEFGLEHQNHNKNAEQAIQANVLKIEEAPYGELIITLENNQQWRQIGADNIRLSKGDTVIISRGMFNSFLLKKADQNRSIRVKRTQ